MDICPFLTTQNEKISLFLEKIKIYLTENKDNIYKINAFDRASKAIKTHKEIITSGAQAQKDIRGVGKSINLEIEAYLKTGTSSKLIALELNNTELKSFMNEFTQHLDVDPETAYGWYKGGFLTQKSILENCELSQKQSKSFRWKPHWSQYFNQTEGLKVCEVVKELLEFREIEARWDVVGPIGRKENVLNDISMVVETTKKVLFRDFIEALSDIIVEIFDVTNDLFVGMIQLGGEDVARVLRIYGYKSREYPFGYLYRMGSDNFNRCMAVAAQTEGFLLTERYLKNKGGEKIKCKTEKDIFDRLEVTYIEPMARQNWIFK